MFGRFIALACASLLLAACQYKAEPAPVGAFNIPASFDNKLPGKYLLYVDVATLDRDVKPTGLECSAHSYPLALSASFRSATLQTFRNLVDEIELVDAQADKSALAARGARGMLVVRGEQLITRLRANPGIWSATMETDVEIVASLTVDGRQGRLLGTTVSGTGRAETQAGGMCEGGAQSLGEAATQSMRQTLTRMGEALANSERVRSGV